VSPVLPPLLASPVVSPPVVSPGGGAPCSTQYAYSSAVSVIR